MAEPLRGGRAGHYLAALGAIALIASLWLDWYVIDVPPAFRDLTFGGASSGWEIFSSADVVLCTCGLAVLALTVLALGSNRAPSIGRATAAIGSLAAGLVIVNMIDQPGPDQVVGVREGPYVALTASVAIVIGGLVTTLRLGRS